ncbi:MAG: acetoacetate--CoA ligase [Actinomycetota bacterium]
MTSALWQPPADAWDTTRLGDFARRHRPEAVGNYAALWQWSVDEPAAFWRAVWTEFELGPDVPVDRVLAGDTMPGMRWFDGVKVNYAERALAGNGLADDDVAIICGSQSRDGCTLTLAQLRDQVRRAAAGLRRLGVGPGDRVAAFLPNIDETLVAFLATASIGAIWSSCAPEFGVRAVLDRWSQVEPTVLLTVDGYRYGAKDISVAEAVADIRAELTSLSATVRLRYLPGAPADAVPDAVGWDELLAPTDDELTFEPVPFDHPLYILYSSGTTGLPKPIVHGHGGILLEHTKQIALHMNLGPGDRLFWFSTTGWMMWNFVVSGLLAGSAVVLYDGNPGAPDLNTLWSFVADTSSTFAGFSAPFIMACRDAGLRPAADHDLSAVTGIGSTGAPLAPAGFDWLAAEVGLLPVANISGGTDVCSGFLGSAPVLPTISGALSCRQLGWDIQAFDPAGNPLQGQEGELVITTPAPSMPVGFWGDDDGARYTDTYFATYPGVWHHGDWITIAADGTCVISGRSDATLNRGGVRLGTADFYAIVEADTAVDDSLVIHLEDPEGGMGELLLFVVPAAGAADIDDEARTRLASTIRSELSPRHTPDRIEAVAAVPRTLSGKKLEVPVKRILQGVAPEVAASSGSLVDPTALDPFIAIAADRKA